MYVCSVLSEAYVWCACAVCVHTHTFILLYFYTLVLWYFGTFLLSYIHTSIRTCVHVHVCVQIEKLTRETEEKRASFKSRMREESEHKLKLFKSREKDLQQRLEKEKAALGNESTANWGQELSQHRTFGREADEVQKTIENYDKKVGKAWRACGVCGVCICVCVCVSVSEYVCNTHVLPRFSSAHACV